MDLNLTYLANIAGNWVGDFVVQAIAGIIAGLILIWYTVFVIEPKREAKQDKKEAERTER